MDLKTVGRQLGVKYVLEGSVRRSGDTVRINAQLIDAATGGHLWAERYDGTLSDVFALQDRITEEIVEALEVTMTGAERELTARKETDSPEAYDAFLKGWQLYRRFTTDDIAKAISFFEKAVKLDPNYSRAYAALAATYWSAVHRGSVSLPGRLTGALTNLRFAMEDPTPLAHQVSADMLLRDWRHDEAMAQAERALALDKGDLESQMTMAWILAHAGKASEAVPYARRAMRLDPNYPAYYDLVLGVAYYGTGNTKDAIVQYEKALARNPSNLMSPILLAAAYAEAGDIDRARKNLEQVTEMVVTNRIYLFPFRDAEVSRRFGNGLVTAGACCEEHVEQHIKRMRARGKMK